MTADTTPCPDISAVEQTLHTWYKAIHTQDLQTVANMLTENFIIVEQSELLNKKQLMHRFEEGKKYGIQSGTLKELNTQVQGDTAWTTLHNYEIWTPFKGKQETFEFLETVIFLRSDQKWYITRYHASQIKPSLSSEGTS